MTRTVKIFRAETIADCEKIKSQYTGYTIIDDFDAKTPSSVFERIGDGNTLIITSGWRKPAYYAQFYYLASGCNPGINSFNNIIKYYKSQWKLSMEITIALMIWPKFGIDYAIWPAASEFKREYTDDHPDVALSTLLHSDYPRAAIIGKRPNLEHVKSNVECGYDDIYWYHKLEDTDYSPHLLLVDVDKPPSVKLSGYKLYSILDGDTGRASHIMKTLQNSVVIQLCETPKK